MNHKSQNLFPPIRQDQIVRFQKLIFDLYQCCQKRIQRQSDQLGLPDAELRCLRLFDQERYRTPKAIASQMGVVKSRITKIIEGLVGKGLIRRAKDPEDSRVTLLSLTPSGQSFLDRINASMAAANQEILARMPGEQRDSLLVHLEMLQGAMAAAGGR